MSTETILFIELTDPADILGLSDQADSVRILEAHYRIIFRVTGELPMPMPRPGHRYSSYREVTSDETALRWAVQIQTETRKALSDAAAGGRERRGPRLQCGLAIVRESPTPLRRLSERLMDMLPWRNNSQQTSLSEEQDSSDELRPETLEEIDHVLDVTTGGRIVCSEEVHEELKGSEIYRYYGWQKAARPVPHIPYWERVRKGLGGITTALSGQSQHGTPRECLYDDAQVLLNAPFERVFSEEVRAWIEPSRTARGVSSEIPFPERPHVDNELVGLALSGGGMRSGVFSLGVLQALSRHCFLPDVDYVSTVSGGGYVGSALSALTSEKLPYEGLERLGTLQGNFPFAFPRPAGPGGLLSAGLVHGNESPAVKHVRENAAMYGTNPGLFDAKTWIIAGRYFGSTIALWLLFLLPIVTLIGLCGIVLYQWLWNGWLLGVMLSPLVIFGLSAVLSNLTDEPAPKAVQRYILPVTRVATGVAAILTVMLLLSGGVAAFNRVIWEGGWHDTARIITGVVAATSAIASVVALNRLWEMSQTRAIVWRIVLALGGYLVLAFGIIAWLSLLWQGYDNGSLGERLLLVLGAGGACLCMLGVTFFGHPLSRGFLNYLSLHRIYAPLLAKTWVIAARPETDEVQNLSRWTRVWPRDDIHMADLRPRKQVPPIGPYHLICTALNLPGSTSKKLLDRKSDSFVIAPLRSGSALTRWIKTEDHYELDNLRLSQAAAVSGAAISPNAGEHTSRTFSIMATLFNARLGRWVRNPRTSQNWWLVKWFNDAPFTLYWKEMFGQASHEDGQMYLSDGGHFENLGLYELLRRRCKYVIAVSADVGPLSKQFDLGNIGNALRLARVDFGVEAELGPFKPLMHDPKTGFVPTHYAAGKLIYPANGSGKDDSGVLIFIKTGLREDDLAFDVAEHWMHDHRTFPYDSTLHQQYDQPTFESYRQLGYLAARAMCKSAGPDACAKSTKERFEAVRNAYHSPPTSPGPSATSADGGTPGVVVETRSS